MPRSSNCIFFNINFRRWIIIRKIKWWKQRCQQRWILRFKKFCITNKKCSYCTITNNASLETTNTSTSSSLRRWHDVRIGRNLNDRYGIWCWFWNCTLSCKRCYGKWQWSWTRTTTTITISTTNGTSRFSIARSNASATAISLTKSMPIIQ